MARVPSAVRPFAPGVYTVASWFPSPPAAADHDEPSGFPIAQGEAALPMGWVQFVALALAMAVSLGGHASLAYAGPPPSLTPLHQWYPVQKIYDVAASASGFVYLASDEGIVRVDGQQTSFWAQDLVPKSRAVDALLVQQENHEDVVWAAVRDQGIWRVSSHSAAMLVSATALDRARVTTLHASSQGGVWIGTTESLWLYERDKLQPTNLQTGVTSLAMVGNTLWVGTSAGLYQHRPHGFTFVEGAGAVLGLASDKVLKRLWVTDEKAGLLYVDPGSSPSLHRHRDPGDRPTALAAAMDGGVWLATRGRCQRIGVASGVDPFAEAPCAGATKMVDDARIGLWVAGQVGRLQVLGKQPVHIVQVPEQVKVPVAFAALADANGVLWATTVEGIVRITTDEVKLFRNGTPLQSYCNRSLHPRSAGGLWVATCDKGLQVFDDQTQFRPTDMTLPDASANMLTGVFESSDHTLWMSSLDGTVFQARQGVVTQVVGGAAKCDFAAGLDRSECDSAVVTFAEAPLGTVWFGTRGAGLFRFDGESHKLVAHNLGITGKRTIALHRDARGRLWLGTADSGLYLLQSDRFVPVAFGNPPRSILGIAHDPHGWLWFTHEEGVSKSRIDDILAHVQGQAPKPSRYTFAAKDGALDIRIVQEFHPSLSHWQAGAVAVPTSQGLMLVDDTMTPAQSFLGKPQLDAVHLDGTSATPNAPLRLGFAKTHASALQLGLAVPYAGDKQNLRVRYRILGVDADWRTDDGSLVAVYRNLRAGVWQFEVQAFVAGFEREAVLRIYPLAIEGFYQQPLGIFVVAVCALALVILVVWARERWVRLRFASVLAERNSIARDVHDTIAQHFTTLGMQLQRLKERIPHENGESARKAADEASEIVERCRMEVRHVIRGLRRPHLPSQTSLTADIEDLVAQLKVLNLVEIRLEQSGKERRLTTDQKRHLSRLVQEAITNALAHGQADTINLQLDWKEDALCLTIADDGVGFDRTQMNPQSLLHFGLRGMSERAELLGASLDIKSEDQQGTCVTIKLKLGSATKGSL